MSGTAREVLTSCILRQLRGCLADENCPEYRAINKHRDQSRFSFIFCYASAEWGTAFALATLNDELLKKTQLVMMKQNKNELKNLIKKVKNYAAFRAVQQDEGGTFLWEFNSKVVDELS